MNKLKKFDIVILLGLILLVVLAGLKFARPAVSTEKENTVQYQPATVTYRVEGVRQMTIDAFKVGHELLSDESNAVIGEITNIVTEPYVDYLVKDNGDLVYASVPGRFTIDLEVTTELSQREIGYFAKGITEVKVNSETIIYTKYVRSSSKVKDINFE